MYGVDFDDTLNFVDRSVKYSPNKNLVSFLKGKDFVIVTARGETPSNIIYLDEFCKEYGLSPIKTYFTNGDLKGDLLKRLKVSVFIDDNFEQLRSCEDSGISQCIHPKDFHNTKTAKKKDPKKGTGKKPKGSGRRLYTDENPKDTCKVSFTSASAVRETFSSSCFKSKSHARQSQIINLVHQRVRAAHKNAKDPKVKARLKKALEYAEKRKEASKKKTERLRKKRSNEIFNLSKKANLPFSETKNKQHFIRKFSGSLDPKELNWHKDQENREIEVIQGNWSFQNDNEIPFYLHEGLKFSINKNCWHRLIKTSNDDLILKIKKEGSDQYRYKFKNELGNDIKVSVEETYDENEDKGLKFNAVKITMEGPNSLSENIVTYQEAEELRSVLTDFLEDSGVMKSTTEEVSK